MSLVNLVREPQALRLWLDVDFVGTVPMDPPENVTGWTLAVEISKALTGEVLSTPGVTASISDAVNGVFTLNVSPDAGNVNLTPGTDYYWRLLRTNGGSRDVLAHGPLEIVALRGA
jgi:hypothetical protein